MRIATYNMLKGGSKRVHWAKLIGEYGVDLLLAQESSQPDDHLPPAAYPHAKGNSVWQAAGANRWGSAIFSRTGWLRPIPIPGFDGWVVGAELTGSSWPRRPVAVFSVHVPAGPGGYAGQANRLLDAIGLAAGRDVVIGGDFNLSISPATPSSRAVTNRDAAVQARLGGEFGLVNCWAATNPGMPPPQTLRWTNDRTVPYHCDGIFVPRHWAPRLRACGVLSGGEWDRLSDHNPVVATFSEAGDGKPERGALVPTCRTRLRRGTGSAAGGII